MTEHATSSTLLRDLVIILWIGSLIFAVAFFYTRGFHYGFVDTHRPVKTVTVTRYVTVTRPTLEQTALTDCDTINTANEVDPRQYGQCIEDVEKAFHG